MSERSGGHSSHDEPASTRKVYKYCHEFSGLCFSKSFEKANVPPYHVPLLVVLVFDDEDHVETGQNGGHEVNVVFPLCVVPAAKHRVGCSQH